jgi:urease accessory protein
MSVDARTLLLLLNWMSPAFPTGAFAYSHGLEWAIEKGVVTTAAGLREWIGDLVLRGTGWNDAVLFARCFDVDLDILNEHALALCSSRERYLETTQLGQAFLIAARVFEPGLPAFGEAAYPVAAGSACRAMGIGQPEALLAFLQGFCAALTSVAVRLVPLGQAAGLSVLRDLMPVISDTAGRAAAARLDDLGSITFLSDIAAMNHEILPSRVFRT